MPSTPEYFNTIHPNQTLALSRVQFSFRRKKNKCAWVIRASGVFFFVLRGARVREWFVRWKEQAAQNGTNTDAPHFTHCRRRITCCSSGSGPGIGEGLFWCIALSNQLLGVWVCLGAIQLRRKVLTNTAELMPNKMGATGQCSRLFVKEKLEWFIGNFSRWADWNRGKWFLANLLFKVGKNVDFISAYNPHSHVANLFYTLHNLNV